MIDFEKAMMHPEQYFKNPNDIVENKELTTEQKLKLLKSWELDIKELQTADDENMAGNNGHASLLREIMKAELKLKEK